MFVIRTKNKDYNVPESWGDCTLPQLRRYLLHLSAYDFASAVDDRQLVTATLLLITGMPGEVFRELKPEIQYRCLIAMSFTSALPAGDADMDFEFEGVTYYLTAKNLSSVEFRKYIDADFLAARAALGLPSGIYNIMPELAAIFYEPKTPQDYKDRVQIFQRLPADVAWRAFDFFYRAGLLSGTGGVTSSAKAAMEAEINTD